MRTPLHDFYLAPAKLQKDYFKRNESFDQARSYKEGFYEKKEEIVNEKEPLEQKETRFETGNSDEREGEGEKTRSHLGNGARITHAEKQRGDNSTKNQENEGSSFGHLDPGANDLENKDENSEKSQNLGSIETEVELSCSTKRQIGDQKDQRRDFTLGLESLRSFQSISSECPSSWRNILSFLSLSDLLILFLNSSSKELKFLRCSVKLQIKRALFTNETQSPELHHFWRVLLNIGPLHAEQIGSYYQSIMKENPCEREIKLDVERTFPSFSFFKETFKYSPLIFWPIHSLY